MLHDLKIVEIGEGHAVQVAGLMLAALGADVLKIERPGGDPSRGQACFANWNRGKRSLELDLGTDDGLATLVGRLEGADVLLHQFTPARAAMLGLDDATLTRVFPRLVIAGITGSPANHPDVERSDDELLVAARFGALYENDGYRAGPIVWRYRAGSWSAAHLAAAGALARLVARLQSGRGGAAHTSIYQGYMSVLPLIWARNSKGPMPNNPPYPLAARPISMQLYQCLDGDWLQIMDPSRQFDYGNLPTMWEVMAEGVDIENEDGKIEAFKRRPLDRWLADFRAADVAVEPAYPLGGMLTHDEVKANGYVVEINDPDLGLTVQPNVPFHSDAALPAPRPAPRLGEGGERDWASPPATVGGNGQPAEVLAGARVLDCGMFLAGPMGPSMMGDMGADVIKLEPLTGDRVRFMHRYYQAASRSKRSIAVDLPKPEAQDILKRLVQWAEALHHNMRFKGAAKLGLSEEGIRAHSPDIAFNYVSAYGQRGDRGNWPGYDSIFNAIAGWEFENAGEGNKPIFNRPGTMDVTSAQNCLVEMMAALYAKRSGQRGYTTQTSLLGVAALTQGETLLFADGSLAPTFHLDSEQTGFGPYHRIFQCIGGQWIAIAAHLDCQRAAVRRLLGEDEAHFATAALEWQAERLIAALEGAGVPCDHVTFEDAQNRFLDDALNRELNLVSALESPTYGLVEQPGAYWTFGDIPIVFKQAAPDIGQHTDEIMREIGYEDAEISRFRELRIIG
jgi:crotonobetainyl-CoA:carnitine CoA-transferase CaiB-like acyl-CoA transferase